MRVSVNVSRQIVEGCVQELWTWTPKTKYLHDDRYQGQRIIEWIIEKNTIKNSRLRNIKCFIDKKLYEYDYNSKIETTYPQQQTITFNYHPHLGQKKCEPCYYFKLFNNKRICNIKGIFVTKDSHYKCQWWTEAPRMIGGTKNLYLKKRPKRDDVSIATDRI